MVKNFPRRFGALRQGCKTPKILLPPYLAEAGELRRE
jgi:hypothetical protein